jgi:hypothetical protein
MKPPSQGPVKPSKRPQHLVLEQFEKKWTETDRKERVAQLSPPPQLQEAQYVKFYILVLKFPQRSMC